MICGTPVIATNEGGLPDFVTQDVGILVNTEDSNALAESVKNIINEKTIFDSENSTFLGLSSSIKTKQGRRK